jgi:acetoin utilization deacetylase AcuC-like enzyme
VLIVDWDVHHCNGTQEAFYERDDVLVFSSHRFPFFPGTGDVGEIGSGAGAGCTINVPLEAGAGDQRVIALYEELLPAVCASFEPDLILISAGFDAHAHDPLGGLNMSTAGFGHLCTLMVDLAEEHADGKLGFVLEGGYDLDALSSSMHLCLQIAAGAVPPPLERAAMPGSDPLLAHIKATLGRYWPRLSVESV